MKAIKHLKKLHTKYGKRNSSRFGCRQSSNQRTLATTTTTSTTTNNKSSSSSTHESLTLGRKLYVWGQMQGSSLGLGANDRDTSLPVQLADIDDSGYRDVSLGNTQCGIVTGTGAVFMFGTSHYGELGLHEELSRVPFRSVFGQNATMNVPTRIEALSGVDIESISCGGRHTACVDTSGNVYTFGWGGNRILGCGGLGHGNRESLNTPKQVEYFARNNIRVRRVSCGEKHTLAIDDLGDVYAFGEGEHGRLGTGHTSNRKVPTKLTYFANTPIRHVCAAKEYSFAVTREEGVLYGWGRNDRGQMGQGGGLAMDMYSCDTIPIAIGQCQNVRDIGLSQGDVLCVDDEGQCFYWGERVHLEPHHINDERFIDSDPNNLPSGVVNQVEITSAIMCFVTDQGELFTCNKTFGMKSDIFVLGQGSVSPHKEAKRVNALKKEFITKIVANDQRCIAIAK